MNKRPKPHPARRARRVSGIASVGGMLVLTGCMAAASTSSTKTAATNSSKSSTTATTATTSSDDDSSTKSTTTTAPAQAGSTASQANTSSHGS